MQRSKRRSVRLFIGWVCLVFGAGICYLGMRYFDYPFVAAGLEPAARAYRAAGYPWEAKDIEVAPPPSDEQNAAGPLRQALAFEGKIRDFNTPRYLGYDIEDRHFDKVEKAIAPFARELGLAAEAAKRPRLDFHRDWDKGAFLIFPELREFEWLLKKLLLCAEARAGKGDVDGMLADLRTGLRLSVLIGQEPSWMAMSASASDRESVYTSVHICSNFVANNSQGLHRLKSLLDEPIPPLNFDAALRGQIYNILANLRNLDLNELNVDDMPSMRTPLQRTGLPVGLKNRAFATRFMQMWVEAKPVLDRYRDDPVRYDTHFFDLSDKFTEAKSLSNSLNGSLFPVTSMNPILRERAMCAATRALLAALVTRSKTGALPTQPDKTWIDPYTKQPLHIARVSGSYRIYSVGQNLKDDGGLVPAERTSGTLYDDIAACFPPRKVRRYP